MTITFNQQDYLTTEEVLRREHSAYSGSRKTVSGPIYFPQDESIDANVAPINTILYGTSVPLTLEANKAYRLIATVDMCFRLSRGSLSATTSDIYLPAKTSIIISAGSLWDRVNVIKATGASDGLAQIVELR